MKTIRLTLVLASAVFAACFSIPATGAQDHGATGRSGQAEASLAGGTAINAELNSSIDSKKAKPGDAVTAHTTEVVKSADDRTILPKGAKLVGHITQASARSNGDGDSVLGVGFDRAILKGGEQILLNVTIQALAAPSSFSGPGDLHSPSPSPGPIGTTRTSPMGSGGGGARPEAAGSAGSYPTSGRVDPDPGMEGGANPSGALPRNSRGVLGLKGLTLRTATTDNAQVSVVTSDGKNVHLDGGTRLLLVTQTLAPEAPSR